MIFLVSLFLGDAWAATGDNMTQSEWRDTCRNKETRLKREDFSSEILWRRYQLTCQSDRESRQRKRKPSASKQGKNKKSKTRQYCEGPIDAIAVSDHPRCCSYFFKKLAGKQSLKELAQDAVSVPKADMRTAAFYLIKGPVAEKMGAMNCVEHLPEFKEFLRLVKRLTK